MARINSTEKRNNNCKREKPFDKRNTKHEHNAEEQGKEKISFKMKHKRKHGRWKREEK